MAAQERHKIFVNFKTYAEGSGRNAEVMAKKLNSKGVVLIVQNADIYRVSKKTMRHVFAQHADPAGFGQFTGKDTACTLKQNGASGILINHSEDRTTHENIDKLIRICRGVRMTSLVCVRTPAEAARIARLGPDIVAIEPPELIGTGISVSTAKPQIVRKAVAAAMKAGRKMTVVCGAGISTAEDVRKAVELGCGGVLLSSAVMKAKNPAKAIRELAGGF